MSCKVVVSGLFLALLVAVPVVFAVDDPLVQAQVDVANRFLQAEVSREIRAANEATLSELKDYQDENFRTLDDRMTSTMAGVQQKAIVGVIGASLFSSAIVALFMFRLARKYAYEQFIRATIDGGGSAPGGQLHGEHPDPSSWRQAPPRTIGVEQGQAYVSNASAFNNWQVQPTYAGGWQWEPESQYGAVVPEQRPQQQQQYSQQQDPQQQYQQQQQWYQ